MRNFDEDTITQAVLDQVRGARDPRTRFIGEAVVRHLHALVREVEPTQAEWMATVEFLTRTGQMCSDTRQEFILLSDTLGVSMLVDAINHRLPSTATATTVLGPFYVQASPEHGLGDDISGSMAGTPLLVEGTVSRLDGTRIAGAVIDTWHTAATASTTCSVRMGWTGWRDARGSARTAMAGSGSARSCRRPILSPMTVPWVTC